MFIHEVQEQQQRLCLKDKYSALLLHFSFEIRADIPGD